MKKSIRKLCAGLLALCMASALMAAAEPENIFPVAIGDIGELNTDPPTAENLLKLEDWLVWSDNPNTPPYTGAVALDKDVSKLGQQSIRFTNSKVMGHSCAYFRLADVKPGKDYTLMYSVKTEDVIPGSGGYGAFGLVKFIDEAGNDMAGGNTATAAYMTNDWTDYTVVFKAPDTYGAALLQLTLWQGKGTAWFDDIRLYEGVIGAEEPTTEAPQITEPTKPEITEPASSEESSSKDEQTSSGEDIFEEKPVDTTKGDENKGSSNILPFVLVGVGVVVAAAAVVAVVVIKKKKKS